jgi:hypothetical protein
MMRAFLADILGNWRNQAFTPTTGSMSVMAIFQQLRSPRFISAAKIRPAP